MTVSVVVNTRDRPDRLALVLGALSGQRDIGEDLEVVVVDDGSSTDLSPALRGHGRLDITLARQPPLGYTAARNLGLRTAAGEVILCLDDDVLFDSDFVATHARAHAEHPAAVVVGDRFNTYLSDVTGGHGRAAVDLARAGDLTTLARYSRRDFYAARTLCLFDRHPHALPAPWLCFVTRNVSFRAADALALGGFDEGFDRWGVDDIELGLRMHRAGAVYHYRPAARVYHLETPLSPHKYDDLRASLRHFARRHAGVEPRAFRDFVLGELSLEELCASVDAGRLVRFADRTGELTWFRTQR